MCNQILPLHVPDCCGRYLQPWRWVCLQNKKKFFIVVTGTTLSVYSHYRCTVYFVNSLSVPILILCRFWIKMCTQTLCVLTLSVFFQTACTTLCVYHSTLCVYILHTLCVYTIHPLGIVYYLSLCMCPQSVWILTLCVKYTILTAHVPHCLCTQNYHNNTITSFGGQVGGELWRSGWEKVNI